YFSANWRRNVVSAAQFPVILDAFENCMALERANEPIDEAINNLPYDVGLNVLNAGLFDKNAGFKKSQTNLIRKYFALHPDPLQTFLKLRENTDLPFADSLIKVA